MNWNWMVPIPLCHSCGLGWGWSAGVWVGCRNWNSLGPPGSPGAAAVPKLAPHSMSFTPCLLLSYPVISYFPCFFQWNFLSKRKSNSGKWKRDHNLKPMMTVSGLDIYRSFIKYFLPKSCNSSASEQFSLLTLPSPCTLFLLVNSILIVFCPFILSSLLVCLWKIYFPLHSWFLLEYAVDC